jgi:hypothetical protein
MGMSIAPYFPLGSDRRHITDCIRVTLSTAHGIVRRNYGAGRMAYERPIPISRECPLFLESTHECQVLMYFADPYRTDNTDSVAIHVPGLDPLVAAVREARWNAKP